MIKNYRLLIHDIIYITLPHDTDFWPTEYKTNSISNNQ